MTFPLVWRLICSACLIVGSCGLPLDEENGHWILAGYGMLIKFE